MGSRVALALAFVVATSAARAQDPQSSAPTVKSVELHLPQGFNSPDLPQLVAVRPGQALSKRAVRRSLERLFATGRFSDAVARLQDVPGGVLVIFELTPTRKIVAVNVDGEGVLSEAEIRAKSGLTEEYYPEKLDAAVQAITEAYHQRGYFNANVSAQLSEVGNDVEITLTVDSGPATRVSSISITGAPGLPLPRILQELGLNVGDVLDQAKLSEGTDRLKNVYRENRYYRARIGDPVISRSADQTASLALPVFAGPEYTFHFHGNRNIPASVLRALLRYDGTETMDAALMGRLARRLENFYRYRGYYDVRVTPNETPSPTYNRAILAFDIDEGRPLRVREVVFSGNARVQTSQLRELLTDAIRATSPIPEQSIPIIEDPLELEGREETNAAPDTPEPDPATVFVDRAYQDAAQSMEGLYHERGFLKATVHLGQMSQDVDAESATVRFDIVEGPQTIIREVSFSGVPADVATKEAVQLKEGEPLALSQVDKARADLFHVLGRRGYIFARVDPDIRVTQDGTAADITLMVESGPQVHVGKVIPVGLQRTRRNVVTDALRIHEGDLLDPEALFESQRALVLLGIFKSVNVSLLNPDLADPVKDIEVNVTERPKLDGDVAGGYFLVDGPRIIATVNYTNVAGLGLNMTARAKVNYVGASIQAFSGLVDPQEVQGIDGLGGRGNAAIVAPRGLGPLPDAVSVRADIIGEREFRPTYQFTRFAGSVGGDWAARRWLDLSLQSETEYTSVDAAPGLTFLLTSLSRANEERLRFPIGSVALQTLRPSVTLDFRDDPANPTSGVLLNATSELTHDLGGVLRAGNGVSDFNVFTLKVYGGISGYVPIARRVVLALSARGGKFFLLDPNSATIAPKRFFLGGGSSLRGFREDGVLPADRRRTLKEERDACAALANPGGCTDAAFVLQTGREVPSEGGELFTLYKTELRFPLPAFPSLDTGIFFEAGNLWLQQSLYTPLELRYVAGTGIRYVTPIGPLAFDIGFNLAPDNTVNEPTVNLHFSIGLF
ncbi:MAG: POTRA domain-containing protein [Myxococcaceae bacterium]